MGIDGGMQYMLGATVKGQYKEVIQSIVTVAPHTTIYTVAYPTIHRILFGAYLLQV